MSLALGSLFSGYGGLDMAVRNLFADQRVRLVFCADIEPGPMRILRYHWPDVPNLGDVTRVDWTRVPRVDVLAGSSPCQDVSTAGLRRGLREGTRSGLWSYQADAIRLLKPRWVVWENVPGVLTAHASSRGGGPLRALGRVAGDLTGLGYDLVWRTVEAAQAGAPHHRARLFLLARPRQPHTVSPSGSVFAVWDPGRDLWVQPDATLFDHSMPYDRAWPAVGMVVGGRAVRLTPDSGSMPSGWMLPTPQATDGVSDKRTAHHRPRYKSTALGLHADLIAARQPVGEGLVRFPAEITPVIDGWERTVGRSAPNPSTVPQSLYTAKPPLPAAWLDPAIMRRIIRRTGRFRSPLGLDTPWFQKWMRSLSRYVDGTCFDGRRAFDPRCQSMGYTDTRLLPGPVVLDMWNDWWRAHGRRQPPSSRQLSPLFAEWMMGLPAGWVTDPMIWGGLGLARRRSLQLRALGNGVVPQQGAMALQWCRQTLEQAAGSVA